MQRLGYAAKNAVKNDVLVIGRKRFVVLRGRTAYILLDDKAVENTIKRGILLSWIYAFFQGVLQGITEFLPISSDGHLSLFNHFFGSGTEDPLLFVVLLHLGTLLAVFIMFRKRIWSLILEAGRTIRDIFTGRFSWRGMSNNRRFLIMVVVSLIPLAVLYFFSDYMEAAASDDNLWVESVSFIFSGIMMLLAAKAAKSGGLKRKAITVPAALAIGFFQGLAALPGVSRSGSTIAIALLLGYSKSTAVDFSFIIGIPAILAANAYKILKFLLSGEQAEPGIAVPIIIGIVVSAVVGLFAIKLLQLLVKKDKFNIFGIYCIVVGVLCAAVSTAEAVIGHTINFA